MTASGAARSKRYRAKKKAARHAATVTQNVTRDADDAPPLDVLTQTLERLCSAIGDVVSPEDVIAGMDESDLPTVAINAELVSAWTGALATLAGAEMKRGRA